jgi:hypothetical protein
MQTVERKEEQEVFGSLIGQKGDGILLAPPGVLGGCEISEDATLPDYVRYDQRERFFADEEKWFNSLAETPPGV